MKIIWKFQIFLLYLYCSSLKNDGALGEWVDPADLKSSEPKGSSRFESERRYYLICGISSEGRIRTFQFEVWVRSPHSALKNNYYFLKK